MVLKEIIEIILTFRNIYNLAVREVGDGNILW